MKADWVYRRGDIYLANLNPFKGSEQGGKRPVVVLQNNIGNRHSSTLIIAPITSRVEKNTGQPTHVNIGRIGYNHVLSVVQLEQIRTIDKQRVIRYFGRIDRSMMKKVEEGMLISLGIKVLTEEVNALEPIMTTEIEERASDPPAPILTRYVNLCDKYTLTIEEAAAYFGIGQKKIRSLVQTHENDDFILHVGVKVLIKRKKFENFIDRSSEV